jgi:hypothetical protein
MVVFEQWSSRAAAAASSGLAAAVFCFCPGSRAMRQHSKCQAICYIRCLVSVGCAGLVLSRCPHLRQDLGCRTQVTARLRAPESSCCLCLVCPLGRCLCAARVVFPSCRQYHSWLIPRARCVVLGANSPRPPASAESGFCRVLCSACVALAWMQGSGLCKCPTKRQQANLLCTFQHGGHA